MERRVKHSLLVVPAGIALASMMEHEVHSPAIFRQYHLEVTANGWAGHYGGGRALPAAGTATISGTVLPSGVVYSNGTLTIGSVQFVNL